MFGLWLFNFHLYHASLSLLTSWLREITTFLIVLFTFLESFWYFFVPCSNPHSSRHLVQSVYQAVMMSSFCHLPNYIYIFFWLLLVISSSQTHATKQLPALTTAYIFQKETSWVVWTNSFIFARGLYMGDVDAIITRQRIFNCCIV